MVPRKAKKARASRKIRRPILTCALCGGHVPDEMAIRHGNYVYCSPECAQSGAPCEALKK